MRQASSSWEQEYTKGTIKVQIDVINQIQNQVRGITTRMGPLGIEDDGEEDDQLIDITLGAQLDPRL